MRKSIIGIGLVSLVTLSACGSGGFLNRDRPDEFTVSRQAPLVIPPDFALTPPRPGEPRPQTDGGQQQTLEAMFGGPQARSITNQPLLVRLAMPMQASALPWAMKEHSQSIKAV